MTQEFVTLPREVVEQGLAAMKNITDFDGLSSARQALRAALDQPQGEQEPVAWCVMNGVSRYQLLKTKVVADALAAEMQKRHDLSGSIASFHVKPAYTHPQNLRCKATQARLATLWGYEKPQPKREPLTDMQKMMCWSRATHDADVLHKTEHQCLMDYASEIEAAHNIK